MCSDRKTSLDYLFNILASEHCYITLGAINHVMTKGKTFVSRGSVGLELAKVSIMSNYTHARRERI